MHVHRMLSFVRCVIEQLGKHACECMCNVDREPAQDQAAASKAGGGGTSHQAHITLHIRLSLIAFMAGVLYRPLFTN